MNLIWFRNNLRVADNAVLTGACQGGAALAVYFFDPAHFEKSEYGFKKTERYRGRFLIETVTELRGDLKKLNITLLVFHDRPQNIVPGLIAEYGINRLYLQKEWTRDENLELIQVVKSIPTWVEIKEVYDQFLFHPEDIPYDTYGMLPEVFTDFRKKCEKYSSVRPVLPVPNALAKDNYIDLATKIPCLEHLGLAGFEMDSRTAFPFRGGEDQALLRMAHYFWKTEKLAYYKKTRNGLVGQDYSSKLSAWLANGSISPRTVYWEVKSFEANIKKNQDTYWLIFELIWRDYFKYVSLKHGHRIFLLEGISNMSYDRGGSGVQKEKWIRGNTGETFINANMKELERTGWMSNRGRQNVAGYWAKELGQDWRIGAAYFESMLIDYDVHSNWGNWMYNSGVGNDPRNRKFNVKRQADMYDPNGRFQNIWVQDRLF